MNYADIALLYSTTVKSSGKVLDPLFEKRLREKGRGKGSLFIQLLSFGNKTREKGGRRVEKAIKGGGSSAVRVRRMNTG